MCGFSKQNIPTDMVPVYNEAEIVWVACLFCNKNELMIKIIMR